MGRMFNLSRVHWLTVSKGGTEQPVNLVESLTDAHEIREITGLSPVETAAVYRLLVVLAHRVLQGPHSKKEWERAWKRGRFEENAVRAYFDRWGERFDLFAEGRPFMQSSTARSSVKGGPHIVRRLVMETCNFGAAVHLFVEARDPAENDRLSPARAASALLAYQAFAPGGMTMGESGKAAPLCGSCVIVPQGANLFETLMLNVIPSPYVRQDVPAWEADHEATAKCARRAHGPLDRLTWQSRRMALSLSPEGYVDGIAYLAGDELEDEEPDIMCARVKIKDEWRPIGLHRERAAWGSAHAILRSSDTTSRPAVLDHVASVRDIIGPDKAISLAVYGLASYQKRIDLARAEILPVTPEVLASEAKLALLQRAMERLGVIDDALRVATWMWAHAALPSAHKETVKATANGARSRGFFWGAMAAPFERLLLELAWTESGEAAVDLFLRDAEATARSALHLSTRARAGVSVRALRAVTIAESVLRSKLRGATTPTPEESTDEHVSTD
jgi:CRISPR system Cascade subunit CasA